jgi:hypothetical protein
MSTLSERLQTLEVERGTFSTAEIVTLLAYREQARNLIADSCKVGLQDPWQKELRRKVRALKAEADIQIGLRLLELTMQGRRLTSGVPRTTEDGTERATFRSLGFDGISGKVMPYRLMKRASTNQPEAEVLYPKPEPEGDG